MCGRFAASASTDDYVEIFGIQEVVEEPRPSFNLAPTDPVPAVVDRVDRASGAVVRKLVTPRWGLVPSWSRDAAGAARLINARVETVTVKPAFRKACAERRCLIPADGFYEWRTLEQPDARSGSGRRPTRKQPYFIRPTGGGLLVMAGLYEFWRPPAGEWLTTCTIITTAATDAVGHVHDRMPLSVRPEDWAAWLDPSRRDAAAAVALLAAAPNLEVYPVATLVNSIANDSPELVLPLQDGPEAAP
nr:SOS response-associated peptidase [Propionibacterium sp.]